MAFESERKDLSLYFVVWNSQTNEVFRDFVVCATSKDEARKYHPNKEAILSGTNWIYKEGGEVCETNDFWIHPSLIYELVVFKLGKAKSSITEVTISLSL